MILRFYSAAGVYLGWYEWSGGIPLYVMNRDGKATRPGNPREFFKRDEKVQNNFNSIGILPAERLMHGIRVAEIQSLNPLPDLTAGHG